MPTPQGIAAANAETTSEAWLTLLEINHQSFAQPIRVTDNDEDLTHAGETYVAFPFELKLPDDDADSRAVGRIEIDDIGEFEDPETGETKTIGDIVKGIPVGQNPTATVTIVLGSDPALVEWGPAGFAIRNVKGDGLTITADLFMEDIMNEPFPCDSLPG